MGNGACRATPLQKSMARGEGEGVGEGVVGTGASPMLRQGIVKVRRIVQTA